jgi:plastocyanin
MEKNLLFIFFLNILVCANAQTETYNIDWSFGSNPSATGDANSNRTIEEGDTVIWNWYASGSHNVVSDASATESFASELMGQGSTFSHTFTQVGINDYVCTPHSGSMFGTITVVPEGTLNTSDFTLSETFNIYPNPASDVLYMKYEGNNQTVLSVSIFNALGQKVKQFQGEFNIEKPVNVSEFDIGLYYVKILQNDKSITKKILVR